MNYKLCNCINSFQFIFLKNAIIQWIKDEEQRPDPVVLFGIMVKVFLKETDIFLPENAINLLYNSLVSSAHNDDDIKKPSMKLAFSILFLKYSPEADVIAARSASGKVSLLFWTFLAKDETKILELAKTHNFAPTKRGREALMIKWKSKI